MDSSGASHLLFFSVMEKYAGKPLTLDLGRTDIRNPGLARFKKEMGARAAPLPYSYFPRPPHVASVEAPGAKIDYASRVWRRLPLGLTRVVSGTVYKYLA